MDTFMRNVRDLDRDDRTALERVVGRQLRETQRIIVQVVNIAPEKDAGTEPSGVAPSWWNVYDSLTDKEVDRLHEAVRKRAELTRSFP